MNIHFDNLHSPEELRALSEALNKIADEREKLRVEFRLTAARDVAPAAEQPAAAVEQEKPAAKKPRAAKAAPTPAVEEQAPLQAEAAAPAPAPESPSEGNDTPAATETASPTASPASSSASVTLEQVRAKLASLSQAGKAADVKALIAKFGAAKLTDIPAEKYAEVLAAAEEIA